MVLPQPIGRRFRGSPYFGMSHFTEIRWRMKYLVSIGRTYICEAPSEEDAIEEAFRQEWEAPADSEPPEYINVRPYSAPASSGESGG